MFSINAQQQTIFRLERWVFFSSFIRLSFIFRGLANFADRFPAAINPSKWMSSNNNGGERAWHALCFFFLLNPFFYIHGHKRVDEERFFFVKKLFFLFVCSIYNFSRRWHIACCVTVKSRNKNIWKLKKMLDLPFFCDGGGGEMTSLITQTGPLYVETCLLYTKYAADE